MMEKSTTKPGTTPKPVEDIVKPDINPNNCKPVNWEEHSLNGGSTLSGGMEIPARIANKMTGRPSNKRLIRKEIRKRS
jgi:hypothetical protein